MLKQTYIPSLKLGVLRTNGQPIRVISLSWSDDTVTVLAQSWHIDKHITTRLSAVPAHIRNRLEPGYRCHAKVNSGADKVEDLIFVNWEAD